jgi:hypothetical protein
MLAVSAVIQIQLAFDFSLAKYWFDNGHHGAGSQSVQRRSCEVFIVFIQPLHQLPENKDNIFNTGDERCRDETTKYL